MFRLDDTPPMRTDIVRAFSSQDADLTRLRTEGDNQTYTWSCGDTVIALGEEDGWWTACHVAGDSVGHMVDEGPDLAAVVSRILKFYR